MTTTNSTVDEACKYISLSIFTALYGESIGFFHSFVSSRLKLLYSDSQIIEMSNLKFSIESLSKPIDEFPRIIESVFPDSGLAERFVAFYDSTIKDALNIENWIGSEYIDAIYLLAILDGYSDADPFLLVPFFKQRGIELKSDSQLREWLSMTEQFSVEMSKVEKLGLSDTTINRMWLLTDIEQCYGVINSSREIEAIGDGKYPGMVFFLLMVSVFSQAKDSISFDISYLGYTPETLIEIGGSNSSQFVSSRII